MHGECAGRQGCCRGRAKRAAWRFGGTEGGGREGDYLGGEGGEAFDGPEAVGWSPVGTAIRRGSKLWPGVPMGWKATGREGGGARPYLQSVVTNVDGRGGGGCWAEVGT